MDQLAEIRRLKERAETRRRKLESALAAISAEISDLDAAERVLIKLSGTPSDGSAETPDEPNLTQLILDALARFPEGATPSGLRTFLSTELRREVNQNSVYGILNRHSKAGRVVNSNGVWTLKREDSPRDLAPIPEVRHGGYGFAPTGPDLDDEIPF
jgi:hypothetical protein